MSEKKQKFGARHVEEMSARGLGEVAQVLPAFPAHGIQPVEAGRAGNASHPAPAQDQGAYETVLGKYSSRSEQKQEQRQISGEMER